MIRDLNALPLRTGAKTPCRWRDVAVAFSLANLCYFRVWSELLASRGSRGYFMAHVPGPASYLAAILNVSLLGAVVLAAHTWMRKSTSAWALKAGQLLYAILFLIIFNSFRAALASADVHYLDGGLFNLIGFRGVLAVCVAGVAAILALLYYRRQLIARAGVAILLSFSPFVLMTFSQAAVRAIRSRGLVLADKPLASRFPASRHRARVVWIVFDEMDQELTFEHRHAESPLPEFDRFRKCSFYAADAYSPSDNTYSVMVSLITGRRVAKEKENGPDDLLVTFEGSAQPVRWSLEPNIFFRARQAGINSGLVGWYHPYCRVVNNSVAACAWAERGTQANSMGTTWAELLRNQARSLVETPSFSPFGQSLVTIHHIQTYRTVLESARRMVADDGLGLVLIHMPVPHGPNIYDTKTGGFTLANSPVSGYFGNLVLADRTLGDLRSAMQAAGTWDRTSVLVTSDHPLRAAAAIGETDTHRRVPFLLKLAGQNEGVTYDRPFNTVVSQDLLLAVLTDEISRAPEVGPWLEQHNQTD